jgi:hypothetical protein
MIRLGQELGIFEIGPLLVRHVPIGIKEIEKLLRGIALDEYPMSYLPRILVQKNRPIRKLVIKRKIGIFVDTKRLRGDLGHEGLQIDIRQFDL